MVFRIFRRKKKGADIDEKRLDSIVEQRLSSYVTQDKLREILEEIEKDKGRKRLWNSLPKHKRMALLKHLMKKKEAQHEKR